MTIELKSISAGEFCGGDEKLYDSVNRSVELGGMCVEVIKLFCRYLFSLFFFMKMDFKLCRRSVYGRVRGYR